MTDRELLHELIDFLDRLDLIVAVRPEWYPTREEFDKAHQRKLDAARAQWHRIKKERQRHGHE